MLVLAALLHAVPVRGEPTLPLAKLEARLAGSFALQAAQQHVNTTAQSVQVETDKSGLRYVAGVSGSARDDVVTNTLNQQFLRYNQLVGVQLPLLGRKFDQNEAIQTAQLDAGTAMRMYASLQRQVLAQLREAYVLYWQFQRQATIANSYAASIAKAVPAARGLRRVGFWTQGEFLEFLVSLSQAKTESQTSAELQRGKLARISSILGQDVTAFVATEPGFSDGCRPRLDDAVASAVAIDPDLGRLEALIGADRKTLAQLRGSSIDAAAEASAGTVLDYPPRSGFNVTVGVAGSLPTHARAEERAHRKALESDIADLGFQEKQRLADIRATVNEALQDYLSANLILTQNLVDERSRREILREAEVRFETIARPGPAPFNEVQSRLAELFVSSRAVATAAGTVLLKANQLLLLAPGACNASHHAAAMASEPDATPASSASPAPVSTANPTPMPIQKSSEPEGTNRPGA